MSPSELVVPPWVGFLHLIPKARLGAANVPLRIDFVLGSMQGLAFRNSRGKQCALSRPAAPVLSFQQLRIKLSFGWFFRGGTAPCKAIPDSCAERGRARAAEGAYAEPRCAVAMFWASVQYARHAAAPKAARQMSEDDNFACPHKCYEGTLAARSPKSQLCSTHEV